MTSCKTVLYYAVITSRIVGANSRWCSNPLLTLFQCTMMLLMTTQREEDRLIVSAMEAELIGYQSIITRYSSMQLSSKEDMCLKKILRTCRSAIKTHLRHIRDKTNHSKLVKVLADRTKDYLRELSLPLALATCQGQALGWLGEVQGL